MTNPDDLDFGDTLGTKSDQLNADDLRSGAITVKITGAQVRPGQEQPVMFRLAGGHMPWKPCKGMLRLLAEISGSTSARPWIGKWVRLFRDPEARWAGKPVGGIRLGGVDITMLSRNRVFRVRVGKNAHTEYKIESLNAPTAQGAPTANLEALLGDNDLTLDDCDRWRKSEGKDPLSTLNDEKRAHLAGWLAADPSRLDAIRALIPQE